MNTKTMNKDNAGSTILLAAMFLTIAAAFGSINVQAKAVEQTALKATTSAQTNVTKTATDALVITATRLK